MAVLLVLLALTIAAYLVVTMGASVQLAEAGDLRIMVLEEPLSMFFGNGRHAS